MTLSGNTVNRLSINTKKANFLRSKKRPAVWQASYSYTYEKRSSFRVSQYLFANVLVVSLLILGLRQSDSEYVLDPASVVDGDPFDLVSALDLLPRSWRFSAGRITSFTPARFAARNFSLMPPTGSTFPLRRDLASHRSQRMHRLIGEQ